MQLVIDIPEEVKNRLGFGVTYSDDIQAICEAIENSTPLTDILDKIRAEIEEVYLNIPYKLRKALDIIDKYRESQAEGEDKE